MAAGGFAGVNDIAQKIIKGYVGINDISRKLIKGYVGVNNVARLCFKVQNKITIEGLASQYKEIAIGHTTDYVVIGGGRNSGNTNTAAVTAYNINGTSTSATNLDTVVWRTTPISIDGTVIFYCGISGSSASSRSYKVTAYDNNLTKTTIETVYAASDAIYRCLTASNSTHAIIAGGTNYSSNQVKTYSYTPQLVKSTLTNLSIQRFLQAGATVGNYIVCCGGSDTYGVVDFYDNSNVKTTATNPYGSIKTANNTGISTTNHAVFFGGNNSGWITNCVAYNSNQVASTFSLLNGCAFGQGFTDNGKARLLIGSNEYLYNDNLVLVEHDTSTNYGSSETYACSSTGTFALHQKGSSQQLTLFYI